MDGLAGGIDDADYSEDLYSPEAPMLEGSVMAFALWPLVLDELQRWMMRSN